MRGWEETQWVAYVIRNEEGDIIGLRDDAPDFIKELWRKEQEYLEECRRTGKRPLR